MEFSHSTSLIQHPTRELNKFLPFSPLTTPSLYHYNQLPPSPPLHQTQSSEFHITDETAIEDPFDFVQPYLECRGMQVTKRSYPFLPVWILLLIFFALKRTLEALDFLGIFTSRNSRLQEAIERDARASGNAKQACSNPSMKPARKRWYHYITPQTLSYMCNSSFLNRTKASLRLDYEPIITPEESRNMSLEWYKNHLVEAHLA